MKQFKTAPPSGLRDWLFCIKSYEHAFFTNEGGAAKAKAKREKQKRKSSDYALLIHQVRMQALPKIQRLRKQKTKTNGKKETKEKEKPLDTLTARCNFLPFRNQYNAQRNVFYRAVLYSEVSRQCRETPASTEHLLSKFSGHGSLWFFSVKKLNWTLMQFSGIWWSNYSKYKLCVTA